MDYALVNESLYNKIKEFEILDFANRDHLPLHIVLNYRVAYNIDHGTSNCIVEVYDKIKWSETSANTARLALQTDGVKQLIHVTNDY